MTTSTVLQRVGAVCVAAVLAAGCGATDAPADDVPELGRILSRIDTSIVNGRYDRARTRLDALIQATRQAREDGQLDDDRAERILASAAALLSDLPEPEDQPAGSSDEPAGGDGSGTVDGEGAGGGDRGDDDRDARERADDRAEDDGTKDEDKDEEEDDDTSKGKAKGRDNGKGKGR